MSGDRGERAPENAGKNAGTRGHGPAAPSAWVRRFAPLVAPGGTVLDLACGGGRHTRLFLARGHAVTALDRDLSGVADLAGAPGLERVEADLEGGPWPLPGRRFAGVIVANYLWRPLFPALIEALAPEGVLIYETFARGNERFGKPSNPDFLLAPDELLARVRGQLAIVAFEQGLIAAPRPAVIQSLCAIKVPRVPEGFSPLPRDA